MTTNTHKVWNHVTINITGFGNRSVCSDDQVRKYTHNLFILKTQDLWTKKSIGRKMRVSFFSAALSEAFFFLSEKYLVNDAHRNACRVPCKVSVIVLPKTEMCWQSLVELPSTKFHESQFSDSLVVSCLQTGERTELSANMGTPLQRSVCYTWCIVLCVIIVVIFNTIVKKYGILLITPSYTSDKSVKPDSYFQRERDVFRAEVNLIQ
jgi:hypothetical protein